jgi:small subunit ribosomal protein S20
MPIIKSAKKRVKVARKAAVRNSKTKRSLKTALKSFAKKTDAKGHGSAQSNVDKAVKKGLMHKNKANRLKKQLAAQAKAAGVKPSKSTKTKSAVKPAAKKVAPAKKPVAKKTPAKKSTTKK